VLFIKELMKEADIAAREMGDTKVRAVHVNRSINVGTWKCKLMVENVETIPGMIF
jgi:hypothetical protein